MGPHRFKLRAFASVTAACAKRALTRLSAGDLEQRFALGFALEQLQRNIEYYRSRAMRAGVGFALGSN
jgi:hypothetical protein